MLVSMAVGVPSWPGAGPQESSWDVLPLVAAVASVLMLRFVLGQRITVAAVAAAVFLGALWATMFELWGTLPVTMFTAAVVASARQVLRRLRPS